MLTVNAVKMQTVVNVVMSQTIPVKKDGTVCFPAQTKANLAAAAANPLIYVLSN